MGGKATVFEVSSAGTDARLRLPDVWGGGCTGGGGGVQEGQQGGGHTAEGRQLGAVRCALLSGRTSKINEARVAKTRPR